MTVNNQTLSQIDEILDFVKHENPKIVKLALEHLNGLVLGDVCALLVNDPKRLPLCIDNVHVVLIQFPSNVELAHLVLQLFINISKTATSRHYFKPILGTIIELITCPESVNADLACMLLSNVSLNPDLGSELIHGLNAKSNHAGRPTIFHDLVYLFCTCSTNKGSGRAYKPNADFHFLSSVFANLSQHQHGRNLFLYTTKESFLSQLLQYITHPNLIRRGGIISLVKNLCFDLKHHAHFVNQHETHFLLHKLLSPLIENGQSFADKLLSGPDFDTMADTAMWLISDISDWYESDPCLRRCLIESLIVLCSTKLGRLAVRTCGAYYVIRELHLIDPCRANQVIMERLVDLLAGDESHDSTDDLSMLLPCVDQVVEDVELQLLTGSNDTESDDIVQKAYLLNPTSISTYPKRISSNSGPKPIPFVNSDNDDDDDLIIDEII